MTGFGCTISVESITETNELIVQHGGEITMPESEIPGVGRHVGFKDTEGNDVVAMQYQTSE